MDLLGLTAESLGMASADSSGGIAGLFGGLSCKRSAIFSSDSPPVATTSRIPGNKAPTGLCTMSFFFILLV